MTTTRRANQYEQNYARLEALMGGRSEISEATVPTGCAPPVSWISSSRSCRKNPETGAMVLSLAHYFEQHGDLCQDPEMTVRVFPHGMVEALTFQQAIPPIYSVVYPEPGKVAPRVKQDLNAFLSLWLRNLTAQGHRPVSD